LIRSYRDLLVWQKSMDLVVESYRITSLLPRARHTGSQVRSSDQPSLFPLILPRDTVVITWAITSVTFQLPMAH